MEPFTVLILILVAIVGIIILCNVVKGSKEGLTLGSGANLAISVNLQDASRLVDQAIRATSREDAISLLRQASDKLQSAIDNLTKAQQEAASGSQAQINYTKLKSQAISAKDQLDDLIKQVQSSSTIEGLNALQRGALVSYQMILGKLYDDLNTPTQSTPAPTPTVYVQPEPTVYVQPIYVPRPPFPGPRPPFPGPRPGPGPFPPGPHPGPGPFPPGPHPGPGPRPPRF